MKQSLIKFHSKNIKFKNLVFILAIFLFSCTSNKLDIDTSTIELDLEIKRFDKDLYELNTENLFEEAPILEKKYPAFFELYTTQVLKIGTTSEKDFFLRLKDFLVHVDWLSVYKDVETEFSDISDIEKELIDVFKHYKYYYPGKEMPEIYTCMSGFNYSVFTDENLLGIGLDFYLGSDSKFYDMAQFSEYQQYNMNRHRITTDCIQAIAASDFVYNDSVDNLMSKMIYNGKLQYFMHAMMPNTSDSILFGYTPLQLKWAFSYEDKAWAFMIEQKHLFTDEEMIIKKYTEAAPFTSYFTNNSAPRLGVFIGWRIVHTFMENHPEISLPELMEISNYQYILNNSSYNP